MVIYLHLLLTENGIDHQGSHEPELVTDDKSEAINDLPEPVVVLEPVAPAIPAIPVSQSPIAQPAAVKQPAVVEKLADTARSEEKVC